MAHLFRVAWVMAICLCSAVSAREVISLDQGWKFVREDASGAAEPAFDDASWTTVDLPHTWNSSDATGGPQKYHRGPAWYRKRITLSPDQAGKVVCLWFGAAGSAAEVFVNGQPVGSHKGAFAAFCFDATAHVKPGENLVAVRVTNVHDTDIAPLSGDFNILGGLYRDAKLLVLNRLAISPLDFASSGVYVKQITVTDEAAEIEVTTLVRNTDSAERNAEVTAMIADRDGRQVASLTTGQAFPAGQTTPVVQRIRIANPHLWNGRQDPYLYTLRVGAGDDQVAVPLGLRYFRFDPDQGFFLNGKRFALHGVNRHQDFAGKGWAITAAEMQTDLDLILEMGCTGVRLAHYQHSPAFYELCDKAGLVVWAELALVNQIDLSPSFTAVTKQQLTELIKQNLNHPSIMMWSLWNELETRAGSEKLPHELELIRQLNSLAHELDSTRPTTAASHKPVAFEGNWIMDIVAFNRYFGWYSGKPEDWAAELDKLHAHDPSRSIGISEYGAGASIKQHEHNRTTRPRTSGPWHPEEWQATCHEQAWLAMKSRPWLWGTFIWVFADFAAQGRSEGDMPGINDKGLVTYDRKVKKDAFWFYKANWSSEPVLYIAARRFTPRPQQITTVKVYSNCESVELKVNGESMGSRSAPDRIFVWQDVTLRLGDNQIEVSATSDGKALSDSCTIVHDPFATTQPATRPATLPADASGSTTRAAQ